MSSKVYFTDFRCPVGTSRIDKIKMLCKAAGIDSDLPSPRLLPDYTRKTETL